jgi:hypothetical protein
VLFYFWLAPSRSCCPRSRYSLAALAVLYGLATAR